MTYAVYYESSISLLFDFQIFIREEGIQIGCLSVYAKFM